LGHTKHWSACDSPPTPITRLVDETPLYNLGESYCQELTLDELVGSDRSDAADRLARIRLGYRTSAGERELRRLVAANAGVADDQVLVTAGAASALFLLGLLLGDGDEEIVVVQPCFPPTLAALRGIDARVVTTQLRFEDGYRLDLAAVSDSLNRRTRLVMLSSPQNPSGVVFTRAEIEQLLGTMSRRCPEALLLVDEVYRESVYGQAPVPASYASLSPRILTCASLSKSHGAAGLRIGWLTVQDRDLYDQLRLAKFNAAISCGALDEVLATELLRRAESLRSLWWRRGFRGRAAWSAGYDRTPGRSVVSNSTLPRLGRGARNASMPRSLNARPASHRVNGSATARTSFGSALAMSRSTSSRLASR
jgi:aspartate/methionine/tyrosine aminotransferase